MGRLSRYLLSAMLCMTLIGCLREVGGSSDGRLFTHAINVDEWRWNHDAVFDIMNDDTLSHRTITLFLRYQPQKVADSISLRVTTVSPNNAIHRDLITLPIRSEKRKRWRGITQVCDLPYRDSVIWRDSGSYKIYVSPAKPTEGVEAIGITVFS